MNWCFTDVRSILMGESQTAKQPLCDLLAYSMFHPTAEKMRERITSYQSSDIHIYACVENNVYLGLIVYRLCDRTATVLDIAVCENARSRGIGTFLIDGLLRESNASQVLAETDDDAIGFYQKYGFKVADTKTIHDCKRYLCRYSPLEIKTITRDNWHRVTSKSFRYVEKIYGGFRYVIGLLTIDAVATPLKKTMFGKELVLADKGYRWLQIAPADESWWLTVMIDPNDNIVQYYYDITDRNILDGENSRFYDLYLDVVVLPDGNATILDTDELDAALKSGIITNTQYEAATATAKQLLQEAPPNLDELEEFAMTVYKEITKK